MGKQRRTRRPSEALSLLSGDTGSHFGSIQSDNLLLNAVVAGAALNGDGNDTRYSRIPTDRRIHEEPYYLAQPSPSEAQRTTQSYTERDLFHALDRTRRLHSIESKFEIPVMLGSAVIGFLGNLPGLERAKKFGEIFVHVARHPNGESSSASGATDSGALSSFVSKISGGSYMTANISVQTISGMKVLTAITGMVRDIRDQVRALFARDPNVTWVDVTLSSGKLIVSLGLSAAAVIAIDAQNATSGLTGFTEWLGRISGDAGRYFQLTRSGAALLVELPDLNVFRYQQRRFHLSAKDLFYKAVMNAAPEPLQRGLSDRVRELQGYGSFITGNTFVWHILLSVAYWLASGYSAYAYEDAAESEGIFKYLVLVFMMSLFAKSMRNGFTALLGTLWDLLRGLEPLSGSGLVAAPSTSSSDGESGNNLDALTLSARARHVGLSVAKNIALSPFTALSMGSAAHIAAQYGELDLGTFSGVLEALQVTAMACFFLNHLDTQSAIKKLFSYFQWPFYKGDDGQYHWDTMFYGKMKRLYGEREALFWKRTLQAIVGKSDMSRYIVAERSARATHEIQIPVRYPTGVVAAAIRHFRPEPAGTMTAYLTKEGVALLNSLDVLMRARRALRPHQFNQFYQAWLAGSNLEAHSRDDIPRLGTGAALFTQPPRDHATDQTGAIEHAMEAPGFKGFVANL